MKRIKAKPKYIRDIEKTTGLECRRSQSDNMWHREWDVLSPTGLVLFRVSSVDGEMIGSLGLPSMYDLQGTRLGER